MKIELREVTVREVVDGYINLNEEGVVGYGGKLNIRPMYQREFIYKPKQQEAVMETVRKDFPLNVMYWVKNADGTFELLDGQQRTLSICSYIHGGFALNYQFYHNLTDQAREQILNYKMMIYFCEGDDVEKLDWFRTINIAGEKLTEQELRNAIYTGTWLTSAKKHFSKPKCAAYDIGKDHLKGAAIRQSYLETAINWISDGEVERYMANNQSKPNANELWLYFQNVMSWTKTIFPKYRKEMKGVPFGHLYNKYKDSPIDSSKIEEEITRLMRDEDVTRKAGIYSYVLTREEKHLNIRAFSARQKREAFEKQEGFCAACGAQFELEEMEADHITPWHEGGQTVAANCQMLCKTCNRTKGGK